jgi:hypothetical protein
MKAMRRAVDKIRWTPELEELFKDQKQKKETGNVVENRMG